MSTNATPSGHPGLDRWNDVINTVANHFEIEPNLVKAHMLYESGGDPNVLGTSGRGCGLMQIDYGTYSALGRWWYASVHGKTDQIFDPQVNLMIACRDFLVPLAVAFPHNLQARIAGYNAGIDAVQKALDANRDLAEVTFAPWYIPRVQNAFEWFEGQT